MFDRPRAGERAVLVHVQDSGPVDDEQIAEFRELVWSAGAWAVETLVARLRDPDPRTLIGAGKLTEIGAAVKACEAEVVIVNRALAPAQERSLERVLECRVIDRIGLILDIFAQRASTFEGKLQVELAQLRHLSTRLVRGWTHLERQKGGIGLRGPGETQLETDRRLINGRIRRIGERLERVARRRALSRKARERADKPVISLVGYTNAGKSTLFNALTGAAVHAEDRLFATLDPTLRRLDLGNGAGTVVLADTVGFIRDLPPDLVAAFRATLEETREASLLLHVVDASATDSVDKRAQVDAVLESIGAGRIPQLKVYNKIDALGEAFEPRIDRDVTRAPERVWVSARDGRGLGALRGAIAELVAATRVPLTVHIPAADGRLRARVFAAARVMAERVAEDGSVELDVMMDTANLERLRKRDGLVTRPWSVPAG